ncbi:hypothetical protein HHK36_002519 [Tetracentron sinense]|uniref:RPW8 domain-containing protein n=1 Tax=Tetracentron sinense TaxID=13715 RepID=A0A835DR74_TETSI|nr:hypothetical protein HHK36_002519 [Tetracentron sinense]
MALQFAGGIVLGAVAGELLKAILDVKDKAIHCKIYLERLESTLKRVIPLIEQINRLDQELLDRGRTDTDVLIGQLKEGKELVRKCSKLPFWNYYQKYRYSKRFLKLDASLLRFFQMDMQVEMWRDGKQLLVDLKEANRRLDGMNRGEITFQIGIQGWCSVPQIPTLTVGLDVPLKELKMLLFKDSISVLGLCAPAGCGKTTLAAKLCCDEQVKGIFKENIFFLTVSSLPNVKVILQRLYIQMACGRQVPEFQNDEDAVKQLGYLLRQREPEPILFVLDDVWSEYVLQKFVFRTKGFKVLVTSRTAFQILDSTYSLKMLSDPDAMTLFSHSAFPQDGNYNRPDNDLVRKVVRGCKGFPLALMVIGHSLRQQPARKWRNTERKLSEGGTIFDSHKDLLDSLATSLDFLDETVRECFMDLGSFPEDQRIPASALIDIWVELHGLDEDDAYVNLLELSTRNLVNLIESTRKDEGEIDGSFNELFIVQHDMLRDLAIYQSRQKQNIKEHKRLIMDRRGNNLPRSWREQDNQPFSARLMSIHTGEMFSSSWCEMQLPKVEVLILNVLARNYTLPQFMEKMSKLKVLIITNHGPCHAKLSDFPRLDSLSHIKIIRLEKVLAPSLREATEPLKNLQKLSLVMCEVSHALSNCIIKNPNMLSKLIEIDIDYCNDLTELPPGICDIVHLQKLSITNCHNLSAVPERIGRMTDLEVLRLHACTGLLELPDSIGRLHKLRFLDVSDCSNLKKMPEGMGELCGLRKLDMRQCSRVMDLPWSIMDLRHLKDVICDEETASLWDTLRIYLPELNVRVPGENINLNWLGINLNRLNFHS